MKIRSTVSVLTLSLALAACGGGADEAGDTDTTAAEVAAVPADAADAGAVAEPADAAADAGTEAGDAAQDAASPASDANAPAAPAEAAAPAQPAPAVAAARPPMFAVCAACHSVDAGKNGIGPSLAGVFGANAGHVASYSYSPAMKDSGLTWDEATLSRYLEDPHAVVPGTKMAYAGLKNADQRKAIVDYLKGL